MARRKGRGDVSAVQPMRAPIAIPANGEQFEELCAWMFSRLGFGVERTGRSGDQGADLVMAHPRLDHRIAVQCKFYGSSRLDNTPVQEVVGSLAHWGCAEGWVVTNSAFTKGARQLASDNHVRLMDGGEFNRVLTTVQAGGDLTACVEFLLRDSGLYPSGRLAPAQEAQRRRAYARQRQVSKMSAEQAARRRVATRVMPDIEIAQRWGWSVDAVRREAKRGLNIRPMSAGRYGARGADVLAYEDMYGDRIAQVRRRRSAKATIAGFVIVALVLAIGYLVFDAMSGGRAVADLVSGMLGMARSGLVALWRFIVDQSLIAMSGA